MKIVLVVTALIVTLLGAVACSDEQSSSKKQPTPPTTQKVATSAPSVSTSARAPQAKIFRSISPREAQTLIAARKDLMLVDLRETKELQEGYIAGSEMIPMSDLSKGSKSLPANRPMLLICAVGGRSYAVGRYFSAKGYQEIYNLKGGISAWKKAGLALEY